jgi:hypothetical protein
LNLFRHRPVPRKAKTSDRFAFSEHFSGHGQANSGGPARKPKKASTDSLSSKVWRQTSFKTRWEKEKNMEKGWFQVKIAIGFRVPKTG